MTFGFFDCTQCGPLTVGSHNTIKEISHGSWDPTLSCTYCREKKLVLSNKLIKVELPP